MATLDLAPRRTPAAGHRDQRWLAHVTPGWFTPVMGTGIVAGAAATLPVQVPGLTYAARAVWVLDVLLLVVVIAATTAHWRTHPATARGHLDDPVTSHAYGAPAMALMTVGAGALLVGVPVVGEDVAVGLAAILWTTGTLLGLWTTVVVPRRRIRSGDYDRARATGSWLLPMVPPMVSAATGPLLVPHLPAGAPRLAMQLACTAMGGLALALSVVVIGLVVRRLVRYGVGPAAAVPTLWIVLGPLGQSVTAAHALGGTASLTLPASVARTTQTVGVRYGVVVWVVAILWLVLAAAITLRTVRSPGGLPFSLAWWSFTFPVGTVVTGTSALAAATGEGVLAVAAVVLYAVLVTAWVVVAVRTVRLGLASPGGPAVPAALLR